MWVSDEISGGCSRIDTPAHQPSVAHDSDIETPELTPRTKPDPPADKKERSKNPTADEHGAIELPDFIAREQWQEFVTMRHEEHGPFSAGSAKGVVSKITRLRDEGYDPAKLLTGAIEGRWQSVHDNDRFKAVGAAAGDKRPRRTATGAMIVGGRVIL